MKIVIPTGIFPPDIGGPASSVPLLAGHWSGKGHDVVVVTYSNMRHHEADATRGYKVCRVSRSLKLPFRYAHYFWKVLRSSWKADVIFAQDAVAAGFPAWLVAKLLRKKYVVKVVGDFAWEHAVVQDGYAGSVDDFQDEKKLAFSKKVMAGLQRFMVRRAGTVIVPSKRLADLTLLWGAREDRLHVVYNGIQKQKTDQTIKRHQHCILAAGRLAYYKRFDVLISAMPEILGKHKDAVLVLVGDGPERETLEKQAEKLGIAKHVQFTGSMAREELMQAMQECGVYAHPSSYEGFSHQLLEAFSMRIPVVASNIGGITELVQDRVNGMLVGVGDVDGMAKSVLRMMDDPEFADQCVRNAARDVKNFTIENQIGGTTDILFEKKPLRPLLLGRDVTLVDEESYGSERMEAYASRVEAMRIIIAGRHDPVKATEVRNYEVEIVDIRPKLFSLTRLFFRTLIAGLRHRPNLIVAQDPFEMGLIATKVGFFLRVPVVTEDHGAFYDGAAWRRESMLNRLRWLLGKLVIRFTVGIRAVNQKGKDAYRKMKYGEPIAVIPVAVDVKQTYADVYDGPFTFIFAGRFVRAKNLALLLAAFAEVHEALPEAELKLIGEGPEEEDILQEIAYFKLMDVVRVKPWSDNLDEEFKTAHVNVVSSSHEGYCRTAAEGLAAGLPVIMTDVGCAGELIRDGKEGFVVPVDDIDAFAGAMKRLASNQDMWKMMRDYALKRSRTIASLDEVADKMAAFWSEVQKI